MRFIDASVFVHAYISPKRPLKPHEKEIKENAKKIVKRVDEGEDVCTSVVHLGEIANVLEDFLPLGEALELESGILAKENIGIISVSREDCLAAMSQALENKIGLNDFLASVVMEKNDVSEIYSFDGDFDQIEKVGRVTD